LLSGWGWSRSTYCNEGSPEKADTVLRQLHEEAELIQVQVVVKLGVP